MEHLDAVIAGLVSAAATTAATIGVLKTEVKHLWAAIKRHEKEFTEVWNDLKALRR